jgi:hypothetical protein
MLQASQVPELTLRCSARPVFLWGFLSSTALNEPFVVSLNDSLLPLMSLHFQGRKNAQTGRESLLPIEEIQVSDLSPVRLSKLSCFWFHQVSKAERAPWNRRRLPHSKYFTYYKMVSIDDIRLTSVANRTPFNQTLENCGSQGGRSEVTSKSQV